MRPLRPSRWPVTPSSAPCGPLHRPPLRRQGPCSRSSHRTRHRAQHPAHAAPVRPGHSEVGTGVALLPRPGGPRFEVSQLESRGGKIRTDPWTDPEATHRALHRQSPNCGWGVCLLSRTTSFGGPLQLPIPPSTCACGKHSRGKVSTHATDGAHSSNAFSTHTPTGGHRQK